MANTEYKFVDHYEFDEELLKKAFAEAKAILKSRGFMREMGWGKAPAITTVDRAKAWMSEGHPFTCDHSEEVCANALKILEAARKVGVPIFHTTTGFTGKTQWDLPRWDEKIPLTTLDINSEWMEIDPKIKPRPDEPVIHKKFASNFFGTHLGATLNYLGVDTVIVMGATAGGCVRHSVMDSTGLGFKTIVPEGCVGDRTPGVIEWNMFDMEAKFCDVKTVDEVVEYLLGIDPSVYTKHARALDQK